MARNKEACKAYHAKYYTENKEALKEYQAKYRAENKEVIRAYDAIRGRTTKGRYASCKGGARTRNIPFEITFAEYEAFILDAVCSYCLGPLPKSGGGLDRIDSSQGYTIDNVVPCCFTCNTMFGAQSKEEAYAHMQRILDVRSQKLP